MARVHPEGHGLRPVAGVGLEQVQPVADHRDHALLRALLQELGLPREEPAHLIQRLLHVVLHLSEGIRAVAVYREQRSNETRRIPAQWGHA